MVDKRYKIILVSNEPEVWSNFLNQTCQYIADKLTNEMERGSVDIIPIPPEYLSITGLTKSKFAEKYREVFDDDTILVIPVSKTNYLEMMDLRLKIASLDSIMRRKIKSLVIINSTEGKITREDLMNYKTLAGSTLGILITNPYRMENAKYVADELYNFIHKGAVPENILVDYRLRFFK